LPQKEFRLLLYLAERRGRVVPKGQLEQMLYGWDEGAESNTVEVYVSALRRKIGADRIRTLRGVGYMMP
ncbi:MAG TPA: DNA-binding response regulator, partial [Citreicella sp.]|nr:DNA-binding response regulator [Citreicella sp.]